MKKNLLILFCLVLVQISAFSQGPFTITSSADVNGTISPSGAVVVTSGTNQSFTITPNAGYYISSVLVDGISVGVPSSYTFTNVIATHTISASFNQTHLALNKPATAQSYDDIARTPLKAVDEDTYTYWASLGAYPQWWKVDLQGIYDLSSLVIRNYVEVLPSTRYYRYNIEASTDDVTYTQIVNKTSTNPSTILGDLYALSGVKARYLRVNVTFNSANPGAHITDFRAYGTAVTSNNITVTSGFGGSVSPSGTVMVEQGANQTFTVTPLFGYKIADVKVDGVSVGALPSYTFTNVTSAHTFNATFTHLVHLALNKPTTAQSVEDPIYGSGKAVDDDGLSFWASSTLPGNANPQWWQVDLGSSSIITSIVIRNFADGIRYYQYNIEGSTDGTNYSPIAAKANTNIATDAGDTYYVTATARYLRVNITFNSANTSAHIRDFMGFGSTYLNVSGLTANTKVYDGTIVATLNTGSAALVGVVTPDVVTLVSTAATGSFADKNVGTNKAVSTSGFTLGGADAGKYTLIQPTAVANITVKELTVGGTFTASNKVYNGTSTATIATNNLTLPDKAGSDAVTLTAVAVFADPAAGVGKTVSLTGSSISGADASNYTLSLTGAPTATANITEKVLFIGGSFTASNKVFDGTAAASIATNSLSLLTKVGTDDVTLTSVAAFANENVGDGKTVSLNGSSLAGVDKSNYTLSFTGAPTATGNITAKPVTITPTAGQSKTVGDPEPAFLYTNSEWSDNNNFTGALGRVAGETAGTYAYTLNTLSAGSNYSLAFVASPATFTISAPTGIENILDINGLTLKNYPNPFTSATRISYTIPFDGKVTLTIRNLAGQVLKTIVNEAETKGDYNINVEDLDLQAGVYLATLKLDRNGKEVQKTIRIVKGR